MDYLNYHPPLLGPCQIILSVQGEGVEGGGQTAVWETRSALASCISRLGTDGLGLQEADK